MLRESLYRGPGENSRAVVQLAAYEIKKPKQQVLLQVISGVNFCCFSTQNAVIGPLFLSLQIALLCPSNNSFYREI